MQGGRGWQVNSSAINNTETEVYLLASKWMIENVFEALDAPNGVTSIDVRPFSDCFSTDFGLF